MNKSVPTTDTALRGRFLIIGDGEEILKALRRQFRQDYEVFTARSAKEALNTMMENSIHVVISDEQMPEMTGSEFFAQISNDFPDAVRLLLTGYADIKAVITAINE